MKKIIFLNEIIFNELTSMLFLFFEHLKNVITVFRGGYVIVDIIIIFIIKHTLPHTNYQIPCIFIC